MMWFRASSRDELIAHFGGEWYIHQPVAVDVSYLALADHKLRATKAMRMSLNADPTRHTGMNTLTRTRYGHY